MASEVFIDTSGFFAILVRNDDKHPLANRYLREAAGKRRRFVTTDYVLDETASLLKARNHGHLLDDFFTIVLNSRGCRLEWLDAERFEEACRFFLKHADQPWSFTDCTSFLVMKQLRIREALTKDAHFQHAGFTALLK